MERNPYLVRPEQAINSPQYGGLAGDIDNSEYISTGSGGGLPGIRRQTPPGMRPNRRFAMPGPTMPMGVPQFNGTPVTPVGGGQMGIHSQTMPYVMPGSQVPMQNAVSGSASPGNRQSTGTGSFKGALQTTQSAYPAVLQKNGGLWAAMQRALQTPGVGANGTQVPMPMNPYLQQWASDPNGYGGYGRR